VAPRTYDTILTTPVVHSSDYSRGNNANYFHEQHQHSEISFQNEEKEEKYDEKSLVKIETQPIVSEVVESVLHPLSLFTNELPRSNEDEMVGNSIEEKKICASSINLRVDNTNHLLFFFFFFLV
jgi:hypothetical protein